MNDKEFLDVLGESFRTYLETSARSNEKLKVLHGSISEDLSKRLGREYRVCSLGFGSGHECSAPGRYMDKMIDIGVFKRGRVVAGLAVKFVMSNYSQNSNNYFENMLGETANLRSNNIPYFQLFIIPDKIPYYDTSKNITKWEEINAHNIGKYSVLSNDNSVVFMHTPNKTFVGIVHFPDCPKYIKNFAQYKSFYRYRMADIVWSKQHYEFGPGVIYNEYETFIQKVVFFIKSL